MKYKVGDEICLSYKVLECDERFGWYRISDNGYLSDDHVEKYAAAKQERPAPDGWEPKPGDRVLVEAEYTGDPDEQGDVTISSVKFDYHTRLNQLVKWDAVIARSAIVGPAPKRARFAVGDVVVMVDTMEMFRVSTVSPEPYIEFYRLENGVQKNVPAHGKDIISLAEARERLAK